VFWIEKEQSPKHESDTKAIIPLPRSGKRGFLAVAVTALRYAARIRVPLSRIMVQLPPANL
jgi:hypothetical protein